MHKRSFAHLPSPLLSNASVGHAEIPMDLFRVFGQQCVRRRYFVRGASPPLN